MMRFLASLYQLFPSKVRLTAASSPGNSSSRRSFVEVTRSRLKPDQDTWLLARAVSLRAF